MTANTAIDRALPPPLWLIALVVAASVMGLTLLTPALPLIQSDLNTSRDVVQKLLTYYLVALAIGQLVYGTVSDRYGRRPVLLFGALLYTVGSLSAALAYSVDVLTVCRIVQGLGAAACLSMGRTIVNDCFDRSDAARFMSTAAMLMALAPTLSLAFGGVIAQLAGWRGTMVIIGMAGLAAFVLGIVKVRETNLSPTSSLNLVALKSAYYEVLRNPIFVCFTLTSGLQVGMFFAMNGFMPYQYARLGYSPMEFGLWFSLTSAFYLVGNTANRLYFVSRGIERAAMIGCMLSLISVMALFASQTLGFKHALSVALPCCLFGLSNGIVVTNTTIGAIAAAGRHSGTGTGISGAWQMAAGGIAGTIIVALGGADNFLIASAGLIVMSLISVSSIYYVFVSSNSVQEQQAPG